MSSESAIIQRLLREIPSCIGTHAHSAVLVGVGDDAAVVLPRAGREWVLSTDAFIEGRHFLPRLHAPQHVGFKALARATSDLAAMGATPRYFLLTLALPAGKAGEWLHLFARGMGQAARMFHMRLIGGDVSRDDHVVAAVTVLGEAPRKGVLTRSGARPGDALYVTGRLGAAQAGLEALSREGARAPGTHSRSYAPHRHLLPTPRVAIGRMLANGGIASAAMDISDGLSTDLTRLCAASGVGAVIREESLPVWAAVLPRRRGARPVQDPAGDLNRALHGGEDYELLFTVPHRLVSRAPAEFGGVPIARIGEMTRSRKILLETGGRTRVLRPLGWDHFAQR